MITIELDLRGMPEVDRLLEEFVGSKLNNRTRRAVRAGAGVMRKELRAQAKGRADLPASFAKTRTRNHRNPIGTSVSPQSPLSNIFEHGANSHQIGGGGQLLSNWSDLSGEGSFFARGPVTHPGMAARPLIAPVFEAAQDNAEEAVASTLFEGIH